MGHLGPLRRIPSVWRAPLEPDSDVAALVEALEADDLLFVAMATASEGPRWG